MNTKKCKKHSIERSQSALEKMIKHTIGIVHYLLGSTDGVSLEVEKWIGILESLGHKVVRIAGDLNGKPGYTIPEMYNHTEEAHHFFQNIIYELKDYANNEEIHDAIYDVANQIEEKLTKIIKKENIDILMPNNVLTLLYNPATSIAVAKTIKKLDIQVISHNHDFYWERIDQFSLSCPTAIEIVDSFLPPYHAKIQHAVINSHSQKQMMIRKGTRSTVIPNVFDFSEEWVSDDYNADFRKAIGLKEDDIYILQATRITARKGIEMAVDFIVALNEPKRRKKLEEKGLYNGKKFTKDSRIVFVLAGFTRDDRSGYYTQALKDKIDELDVDALFIEEYIAGERGISKDGKKRYSLWDAYDQADFITYPSFWEGWGNQLLEAIKSKTATMIYEYPVYKADLASSGLKMVSIGDEMFFDPETRLAVAPKRNIEKAADETIELLSDAGKYTAMVEHNYIVGKENFSLTTLRAHIKMLISNAEMI